MSVWSILPNHPHVMCNLQQGPLFITPYIATPHCFDKYGFRGRILYFIPHTSHSMFSFLLIHVALQHSKFALHLFIHHPYRTTNYIFERFSVTPACCKVSYFLIYGKYYNCFKWHINYLNCLVLESATTSPQSWCPYMVMFMLETITYLVMYTMCPFCICWMYYKTLLWTGTHVLTFLF